MHEKEVTNHNKVENYHQQNHDCDCDTNPRHACLIVFLIEFFWESDKTDYNEQCEKLIDQREYMHRMLFVRFVYKEIRDLCED